MIKQSVFGNHALVRGATLLLLALGLGTQSPPALADPPLVTTTVSLLHVMDETADGLYPTGPLVKGPDDKYYGTAQYGGPNYQGTVFSITSEGVFSLIYAFSGPDGSGPSPLVLGNDGNFYGTTVSGDGDAAHGTVFRLTAAGELTTLHQFNGADGTAPVAPLLLASDGNFYGTTMRDGVIDGRFARGTVFAMTSAGETTTLHTFANRIDDGSAQIAPMVEGPDGSIYGTAITGDSYYDVSSKAYRVTASGDFSFVHDFNPNPTGYSPTGLGLDGFVLGTDGNFYGASKGGGEFNRGSIFSMTPAGDVTTLYSFADGEANDPSGLISDGHGGFFGNGSNSLFEVEPSGAVVTLLNGPSWGFPQFNTLKRGDDGWLYGTAAQGVVDPPNFEGGGAGSVFKIQPANFPHPTMTLSVDLSTAKVGTDVTLTFTSSNAANGCYLGHPENNFGENGTATAPIWSWGENLLSMTCSGDGGSVTRSVKIVGKAPPLFYVSASSSSRSVGQQVTLSWSPYYYGSDPADSCTASGGWSGSKEASGSESVLVSNAGANVYTLACTNEWGTYSTGVSVTGNPPAPTASLAVSPGPTYIGQNATLTWSSTSATSCTASGNWSGTLATSGSQAIVVQQGARDYTLTCSNVSGSAAKTVTVTGQPPATMTLTATPTQGPVGSSVRYIWNSSFTSTCTSPQFPNSTFAPSANIQTFISSVGDNVTTVTCTGSGGTITKSVTVTGLPAVSGTFSANPTSIAVGASTSLTWSVINAQSCQASGAWSGALALSGQQDVPFTQAGQKTFNLTCTGNGGTYAKSVNVTAYNAPVITFTASPATVAVGHGTTLNWGATDSQSCTASGAWSDSIYNFGQLTKVPSSPGTYNYTLTCTGIGGTSSRTATVTAVPEPTLTISANPTTVAAGDNSTLTWSSANTDSCTASGVWSGSVAASGSQIVPVPATGWNSYTLTCTGAGLNPSASVSVYRNAPVPVASISANPTSVPVGQPSTLTWSSTNATSCSAAGAWSGNLSTSGSSNVVVSASGGNYYLLTCSGPGGYADQGVTVTGLPPPNIISFGANVTAAPIGGSTPLHWSVSNATSCSGSGAWTGNFGPSDSQFVSVPNAGGNDYTLTCSGAGGTAAQTVSVTGVAAPVVSLAANPTSAAIGASTQLTWSTTDASSCTASGAWSGTLAASGSQSAAVPASGANSYTLTCSGAGGTTPQTVSVTGVPAPVVTLSANPTSAAIGGNTTLTWSSTDASSCAASGAWSGTLATSGSQSTAVPAPGANGYTLTCTGIGGSGAKTVSVTGVAAPVVSLSANPASVPVGQSSTLTWNATDAQNCTASGGWSGARATSGSASVTAVSVGANNFSLSCTGTGGTTLNSTTVAGLAAPTLSLAANPASAIVGQSSTLTWSTTDAQACTASGTWSGAKTTSGSAAVTIDNTGANDYTLSCSGPGGSIGRTVTVTGLSPATLSFSANPASVAVGTASTLSWTGANVSSCTASGAWSGNLAASGSQNVTVANAGANNYSLSCSGSGGTIAKSVIVTGLPKPTVNISANPLSTPVGQNTTLTWSTSDAVSCTASGKWSGAQSTSGSTSLTVGTAGDNVYTLTCTGGGGSNASSVTVKGLPAVSLSANPTSVKVGATSKLTWSSTNATSCTASGAWTGSQVTSGTKTVTISTAGAKVYTLACTGVGGTTTVNTTVTGVPVPTVTIAANPTSVIVGQNTTLTWSSTDATSCTASGSWTGTKATSGAAPAAITSTGTKTFTLACTGVGGTTSKSATVTGITPAANFATASESTTPGATSTTNITVTLSGPTSSAVTVPFTTGGTATSTSYNVAPSTKKLSFAAGATSATITVNVTAAVCNKTVLLTLTTPTNATLGSAKTNTLTIKSATGCP